MTNSEVTSGERLGSVGGFDESETCTESKQSDYLWQISFWKRHLTKQSGQTKNALVYTLKEEQSKDMLTVHSILSFTPYAGQSLGKQQHVFSVISLDFQAVSFGEVTMCRERLSSLTLLDAVWLKQWATLKSVQITYFVDKDSSSV